VHYRNIVKWSIIVVVLIAVFFIYKLYNPLDSVYFPKCPFKELTGLECPGCGSQRAIHALLNGNIGEALKANILLVLAIPYLITGFIFDLVKSNNPSFLKWRKLLFGEKAIYILLAIIIGFWILRNVV